MATSAVSPAKVGRGGWEAWISAKSASSLIDSLIDEPPPLPLPFGWLGVVETSVSALPDAPARAVRPIRWVYAF